MIKIFKKYFSITLLILFIYLLFKENVLFKNCILNGCLLFFNHVFPSLFPMFILQDFLLNYHFFSFLDFFYPLFKKIFKSKVSFSIFLVSTISGTPANAYLINNLVKEKKLSAQEASYVLSYSCFLNPLFLYNLFVTIFDQRIAFKIIFSNYLVSLFLAFCLRNHQHDDQNFSLAITPLPLTQLLSTSIVKAFKVLITILGTILFYLFICEGLNFFIKQPVLNCFINGFLETTGGLTKLSLLKVNFHFKLILASFFVSFLGLSIHTQIKNIVTDASISLKPFLFVRLVHWILFTSFLVIL